MLSLRLCLQAGRPTLLSERAESSWVSQFPQHRETGNTGATEDCSPAKFPSVSFLISVSLLSLTLKWFMAKPLVRNFWRFFGGHKEAESPGDLCIENVGSKEESRGGGLQGVYL